MNLRDLQYLVSLADQGHFGRAAEASNISQPTLSMQIKKLEQYLDVQLIERQNKKMLLTPIGHVIVEHARRILNDVRDLQECAKAARNPYTGDLYLGAFPTLAPYLLPKITRAIHNQFAHLKLFLVEEKTNTLIEQLLIGKLDAALIALPINEPRLESHILFNDPFRLAISQEHELAHKKIVSLKEMRQYSPLLLLDEGHCLRNQALDLCDTITGMAEQQAFRATSLETLRQMVAMNMGITLIPESAIDQDPRIVYIPFTAPAPSRTIGIVFRKSSAKKRCIESLAQTIRDTYSG